MTAEREPQLQLRRVWLSVGYLLVLNILVLSLVPLDSAPTLTVPYSDKLVHAVVFMLLMIWFSGLLPKRLYPRLFLILAGYGVLIEFLQQFTPYRTLELMDMVADLAGLLVGWGLALLGANSWTSRLERLVKRSD